MVSSILAISARVTGTSLTLEEAPPPNPEGAPPPENPLGAPVGALKPLGAALALGIWKALAALVLGIWKPVGAPVGAPLGIWKPAGG